MAGWTAAAHARVEPVRRPRARPRPAKRARTQRRVTGGVLWIGAVAALLAGVVAMNVAVLRLNMTLDRLGRERAGLRADNAQLFSRLSSVAATGRIQSLAMKRLGYVQATPEQTTYVHIGR
jgi:cell division protein FtsL